MVLVMGQVLGQGLEQVLEQGQGQVLTVVDVGNWIGYVLLGSIVSLNYSNSLLSVVYGVDSLLLSNLSKCKHLAFGAVQEWELLALVPLDL